MDRSSDSLETIPHERGQTDPDLRLLRPGDQVARFSVLGRVGIGAMGRVYAAYDPELDRRVAIKLLLRTNEDAYERLRDEARSQAKLDHPNVVSVYEVGRVGEKPFVAMAFVDGQPLSRWLEGRSLEEIIAVFIGAGRGLEAAHASGLVHRDFKPDNVMVDETGRAQVLDFGLARTSQRATEEVAETRTSDDSVRSQPSLEVTGTPAYMSPEQFMGEHVGPASDQFSFCVAFWEALVGERPFAGDGVAAIALHVTTGELRPPPSGTSGRRAELVDLLRRGLAVDPAERWPSLRELLDAIEHDPAEGRRARRLAVAGGLALVGAIGIVAASRSADEPAPPACVDAGAAMRDSWNPRIEADVRRVVEQSSPKSVGTDATPMLRPLGAFADSWSELRTRACEDTLVRRIESDATFRARTGCLELRRSEFDAVVELLLGDELPEDADLAALVEELPVLSHCLDHAYLDAQVKPPTDPKLEARVNLAQRQLGHARVLQVAGLYERASTEARTIAESADAEAYPPLAGAAWMRVGSADERRGEYESAEDAAFRAYLIAREYEDSIVAGEAAAELAILHGFHGGKRGRGEDWGRLALVEAERSGGGPMELARGHNVLGLVYKTARDYERALKHHQKALELRSAGVGEEHPGVARMLNNVAIDLDDLGRYEEALATYERARDLKEKTLGPRHPSVATSLVNIGVVLRKLERYDEAMESYERAVDIEREAVGEGVELAKSVNNMGDVLAEMGRLEDALARYREAHRIFVAKLGPDHPHVGFPLNNIGTIEGRRDRWTESLAAFDETLRIWRAALPEDHPLMAYGLTGRGKALIELGRRAEALPDLEAAYRLRESEKDPQLRAETSFALARALERGDRARTLAESALADAREAENLEELVSAAEAWLAAP